MCWHKSPKRGRLKGKCALEPFLVYFGANQQEGMFLDLVHLFWVLMKLPKCQKQEKKKIGRECLCAAKTQHSLAHPGWSPANWLLSGKLWWRTTIIHRTVRWCTGLSGEPTAASATVGRQIRGRRVARANGRLGAPDCPVCT
jgi:hypothetical protein